MCHCSYEVYACQRSYRHREVTAVGQMCSQRPLQCIPGGPEQCLSAGLRVETLSPKPSNAINACNVFFFHHVKSCSYTLVPDSSVLSNDKCFITAQIEHLDGKCVLGELVGIYKLVCSIHFSVLGLAKHEDSQIWAAFTFDVHLE